MNAANQSFEARLAMLEAKVETLQVENNLYEYLLCCLIDNIHDDDARLDMKDYLYKQARMYLNEPTHLDVFHLTKPMTYGQVVHRMAKQIQWWDEFYGNP
ncbi:hypothetical protein P7L91_03270 [Bisgaard Taxon 10/6]|uniref:Uncharacterized protein n=1 Tax=Exercitatus varius TaxID=67857 RepID=A0AAW6Q712_9PAST|nr:hypothetical protein [Exercitatus varius]MDG2949327.1 hypothetical protein [Exercitatus varius]MDG2959862.1 hypothetical protein [Exercitatus varius]